jgi:hypothetical protein
MAGIAPLAAADPVQRQPERVEQLGFGYGFDRWHGLEANAIYTLKRTCVLLDEPRRYPLPRVIHEAAWLGWVPPQQVWERAPEQFPHVLGYVPAGTPVRYTGSLLIRGNRFNSVEPVGTLLNPPHAGRQVMLRSFFAGRDLEWINLPDERVQAWVGSRRGHLLQLVASD